ncbi:restriction endonuclease subunit S [Candidatus Microthrix parvicella]|uniref:Putative Restriction modification system DNA specificity domain n=1 Tax=Candidatus Neomicrothrix parvicella RN1 TaxID=1229780 RepID=R4Z4R3_9ACTN|nr:restriction endonuclease subunit S [Candidatus Microthrix parvicella]CCM65894.1 putative Restriction modification system DNA specificity domain [Candidatus Microthrix parvicella RN1]
MITLSDVTELIVDSEHKTAPKSETGHPLVRTSDIKRGRIELSNIHRVNEETYQKWTRRAVPQSGDLILAREAPVGNVAVVTDGMTPVLGQRTVLLRPDRACVDPTYLCALLLGDEAQYWMNAVANGATVPHLNMSDIRALKLPELPDLETQRRTGAAIASFDDLIENNRRRIEILEEMARLLYREWFVHFRFPGHEDVELVNSALGPVPDGWEIARTSDLITSGELEIGDGYRAKNAEMTGGPLRFLRVKNVQEGYFTGLAEADSFPAEYAEIVGPKRSRPGDIAIAMKGSVGRLARVDELTPALVYSPQTSYWRANRRGRLTSTLLYEWMQSPSFVQQCAQVKGATDMADYVNLKDQRSMKLQLPPTELVRLFNDRVNPLLDLASNLRRQNDVLREARDLLLPRLVSGELDVSKLNLDGVLA